MVPESERLYGHKVALTTVHGCHNPETHDFYAGFEIDTEEIKEKLKTISHQDGITLSGGDPFFQPSACSEIASYAKQNNLSVWCYTGYTFEELLLLSNTNSDVKYLLEWIDVLVDGKFEQHKKSLNLYFRGSTNQRILDLPESLKQQVPIEIETYIKRETSTCYREASHTNHTIFI